MVSTNRSIFRTLFMAVSGFLLLGFLLPVEPPKNGLVQTRDHAGRVIREAHYVNDTLHGTVITFNARGDTSHMLTYHMGKRNGLHQSWHENGKLAFMGYFYMDLEVRTHERWHKDGQKFEAKSFVDFSKMKDLMVLPVTSVPDGAWIQWYYTGQKLFEYHYEKGTRVGTWKEWFYTGVPKSERHYKGGVIAGDWTVWSIDGIKGNKFNCSSSNWGSSFKCENHYDEAYTDDIGQCQHCGRGTSSGGYIYCAASACELKKCQVCGGDL